MIFTSSIGYLSGYTLQRYNFNASVIPFLCAMLVTTSARIYTWKIKNGRPLIYIISGLLVLVPGGVGVKGMLRTHLLILYIP